MPTKDRIQLAKSILELTKNDFTKADIQSLFRTLTAFVQKVADKLSASQEERERRLSQRIEAKLSSLKQPRDGRNGRDGRDGKDGKDADEDLILLQVLDQVPPSPSGEDIRNMLEALPEGERLAIEAIEGLPKKLEDLAKQLAKKLVSGGGAAALSPSHTPLHETFTMNGSDTTVTLQQAVAAAGTAIFGLRYNGQVLDLTTHYTVNGNKISFVGFTPDANSVISITYMP